MYVIFYKFQDNYLFLINISTLYFSIFLTSSDIHGIHGTSLILVHCVPLNRKSFISEIQFGGQASSTASDSI